MIDLSISLFPIVRAYLLEGVGLVWKSEGVRVVVIVCVPVHRGGIRFVVRSIKIWRR